MYLQKVISRKTYFLFVFCWRLEGQLRKQQDPNPLVRGMDPRIRIRTKMSWIRNSTSCHVLFVGIMSTVTYKVIMNSIVLDTLLVNFA